MRLLASCLKESRSLVDACRSHAYGKTTADLLEMGHSPKTAFSVNRDLLGERLATAFSERSDSRTLARQVDCLASAEEKAASVQTKIRQALVYPGMLALIGVVMSGVLVVRVLPELIAAIEVAGGSVPGPTQALLAVTKRITALPPVLLGVIPAVFFAVRGHMNRLSSDRPKRAYGLGNLGLQKADSVYGLVAANMLEAGVLAVTAFSLAEGYTQHAAGSRNHRRFGELVRMGVSPSEAAFLLGPNLKAALADSGRSRQASQRLREAVRRIDDSTGFKTQRMVSAIEPIAVLVVSAMLGLVVICTLLPVLQPIVDF